MAYTETTSTSWFDRLGASFRGIGLGIILIIAGTVLLWWNEGSFVATGDALNEASAVTQELGDISKLDNAKNGMLVHAVGPVATKDMLSDPDFGVSINAIRLERTVEFYQWVEQSRSEKRKKLGGGEETVTTYSYVAKWTDRPVDSSAFKDPAARAGNRNFILANMENFKVQAANVTFGAYRLPEFLMNSISGATSLNVNLSGATTAKLNRELALAAQKAGGDARHVPQGAVDNERMQQTEGQDARQPEADAGAQRVHVSGGAVFLGSSPGTPQIGDVRVSFKATPPGTVSLLAKLNGNTFEAYRASNGKTVSELAMGTHSLENMYGDARSSNATMTWILRAAGALLIIIGLKLILAPLAVLADVIPLLGSIVGAGAGLVCILLGLAWSLVIVAIAWLRFRPLIGGGLLALAAVLLVLLHARGRSRKAATSPAPGSATEK